MDDVLVALDEITGVLEKARAMPLSASCIVNRGELLGKLTALRELLPASMAEAQQVLGESEEVVEKGRQEAAALVAEAREERARLVSETEVYAEAHAEAGRMLEESRYNSEAMRAEVEDYVDAKLANFEIVLTKTLSAVERGRAKLSGRHELESLPEFTGPYEGSYEAHNDDGSHDSDGDSKGVPDERPADPRIYQAPTG